MSAQQPCKSTVVGDLRKTLAANRNVVSLPISLKDYYASTERRCFSLDCTNLDPLLVRHHIAGPSILRFGTALECTASELGSRCAADHCAELFLRIVYSFGRVSFAERERAGEECGFTYSGIGRTASFHNDELGIINNALNEV